LEMLNMLKRYIHAPIIKLFCEYAISWCIVPKMNHWLYCFIVDVALMIYCFIVCRPFCCCFLSILFVVD
jgi:hypothetical protein